MTAFASPTPGFLSLFEEHLQEVLGDQEMEKNRDPRVLVEACRHLSWARGAKRMRPLLVDYFGASLGVDDQVRLKIATTAELVHTASLLHDDVVDEGKTRRGQETVNARWNNSVAVLGGDLMLCVALEQLYELPREITRSAVDLVAEMTRAAMWEVEAREKKGWTLAEWERIADGKTGALLAWCGRAPALAMGEAELAEAFGTCGRSLGLAFQLTDDLIDLMSPVAKSGKNRYADLKTGNPSFPVALARSESLSVRSALDEMWSVGVSSEEELEKIAGVIRELTVPATTLERIEGHLDEALEALGPFADRPGGVHIAGWAAQLREMARRTLGG